MYYYFSEEEDTLYSILFPGITLHFFKMVSTMHYNIICVQISLVEIENLLCQSHKLCFWNQEFVFVNLYLLGYVLSIWMIILFIVLD